MKSEFGCFQSPIFSPTCEMSQHLKKTSVQLNFCSTLQLPRVISKQLLHAIPITYLVNRLREQGSLSSRGCYFGIRPDSPV